jgi:hypothetical protein
MTVEWLALIAAALFAWMALVHLLMAFGVRRGELVWSGRYPRRLPPHLRRRSLGYAVFLLLAGWVVAAYAGAVDPAPLPDTWMRSATFVAGSFLAFGALHSLVQGSRWERFLFLPITLYGAILAGWFLFG